jgi:hypothetical protein
MDIISGEKIQKLADIYIGSTIDNFTWNPAIGISNKNLLINDIPDKYDNPKIIFCYGHCLSDFYHKLDNFMNDFVLISGNSDENITENKYKKIADHSKIIKWYSQNVCFKHDKLVPFTIGIANEQWIHGNSKVFIDICNQITNKNENIYFNFDLNTNIKRVECYNKLIKYIPFLNKINPIDNFKRLGTYTFCICPEGNGVDTHRLAECWYLRVVPIVLENDFINIINKKTALPLIILKDWNDLINMKLDYNDYNFNSYSFINFNHFKNEINLLRNI